jgi:hypothetical protein
MCGSELCAALKKEPHSVANGAIRRQRGLFSRARWLSITRTSVSSPIRQMLRCGHLRNIVQPPLEIDRGLGETWACLPR